MKYKKIFKIKTICSLLLLVIFHSILYSCQDGIVKLSGDYYYKDDGENTKYIISRLPNRRNIYSKVIDYNFDNKFILVVQLPVYEEYKKMIAFEIRNNTVKYPNNSKKEIISSEKEAEEMLHNDRFLKSVFSHKVNYWIISNFDKNVIGPLTKEEYIQKRIELKVPENLKIDLLD